jgi:uncharacterized membrane protein YiaA
MNQKNVFTVIGAILVLQGIFFYAMGDKMTLNIFPDLDDVGKHAATNLLQVISMLSILVGLISFAIRNSPQVLWAYTIGFGLFGLNSLKHMFVDHINVPVVAIVIQLGIALVCAYLWMQIKKPQASKQ